MKNEIQVLVERRMRAVIARVQFTERKRDGPAEEEEVGVGIEVGSQRGNGRREHRISTRESYRQEGAGGQGDGDIRRGRRGEQRSVHGGSKHDDEHAEHDLGGGVAVDVAVTHCGQGDENEIQALRVAMDRVVRVSQERAALHRQP